MQRGQSLSGCPPFSFYFHLSAALFTSENLSAKSSKAIQAFAVGYNILTKSLC